MNEPTIEQLANFAAVLSFGPGYTEIQRDAVLDLIRSQEWARETWLKHHREFQEAADLIAAGVLDLDGGES